MISKREKKLISVITEMKCDICNKTTDKFKGIFYIVDLAHTELTADMCGETIDGREQNWDCCSMRCVFTCLEQFLDNEDFNQYDTATFSLNGGKLNFRQAKELYKLYCL